jgi:hypothetical protein
MLWQMRCPSVLVFVNEPFLAEAIVRALRLDFGERALRIDSAAGASSGDVMLAVPATCNPALAREVVDRGTRLLVLAPHIDRKTRDDYERAGASVALMDSRTLTAQVRRVLAGSC